MNLISFALYSVGQLVGGLHLAARLDVLEELVCSLMASLPNDR